MAESDATVAIASNADFKRIKFPILSMAGNATAGGTIKVTISMNHFRWNYSTEIFIDKEQ
jgi:hypothetical protein